MNISRALLCLLSAIPTAFTLSQAPALPGAQAVSAADRIYTADQTSNTITVIKPLTNDVLGTIALGLPRMTNILNPQYLQVVNSHGLGFSLDGKFLSHVSVTTNTLTVIRTSNNSIVSQTSVDRASHEAFFEHDGRTVWVACRGTSFVDLVDGMNGGVIGRIETLPGPSKVLFSPDGTLAYVNHIKSPTLSIIDVMTRKVVDTITGLGDVFSSDMMISADGSRLWAVHKMIGKTSIIDLETRAVVTVLDTGLESNHPNFAIINGTTFGFITVAASNETRVYQQDTPSSNPIFVESIPASGIEPHGIWGSPDNRFMYWVNEHSDTVDVLDLRTMSVISTLPVGQESQALVFVANAVPISSNTTSGENLGRQGLDKRVENRLISVTNSTKATALFTIRELDGLDMVQIIGRSLQINQTYVATAACTGCGGEATRLSIVKFKATVPIPGELGCAVAPQVLSFLPFFDNYDIDSLELGLM
ncbi:nitrous oxide reductase [Rhexocercosporidium sp. MPI-PUGE-AT-0058]|nr:nitrous oxide reductase [Rhexocercosporidium sp. MPI-PUGE-AT-0058]